MFIDCFFSLKYGFIDLKYGSIFEQTFTHNCWSRIPQLQKKLLVLAERDKLWRKDIALAERGQGRATTP